MQGKLCAMAEKLILSPVLNFLSRSLTDGVKQETIQKAAVAFFDHDQIIQAKKILYTELSVTSRVVIHARDEENILDMCKNLVSQAKQNANVPKFVILNPGDVSTVGEAFNSKVVSKVNELSRKLDGFITNVTRPSASAPPPSTSQPNSTPRPLFAVILKNSVSSNCKRYFVEFKVIYLIVYEQWWSTIDVVNHCLIKKLIPI